MLSGQVSHLCLLGSLTLPACLPLATQQKQTAAPPTQSALEQVFISNECGIELTVGPGALASSAFWTLRGASAYVAGRLGTTLTHIFQQHSMYNMVKVCHTWQMQHSHPGCRGMRHTPLQTPADALAQAVKPHINLYVHSCHRRSGQAQLFCCLPMAPALQQLPASQACTGPCRRHSMAPLACHGAVLR